MKGIDTIDLPYYTVAVGDGQTTTAWDAGVDVGGPQDLPRSAAHPFYTRLNQTLLGVVLVARHHSAQFDEQLDDGVGRDRIVFTSDPTDST